MARTKQTAAANSDFLRNVPEIQPSDEASGLDARPHEGGFQEAGEQKQSSDADGPKYEDHSSNASDGAWSRTLPSYANYSPNYNTYLDLDLDLEHIGTQYAPANTNFLENLPTSASAVQHQQKAWPTQPSPSIAQGQSQLAMSNMQFMRSIPPYTQQPQANSAFLLQQQQHQRQLQQQLLLQQQRKQWLLEQQPQPNAVNANVNFLRTIPYPTQLPSSNLGFLQNAPSQGQSPHSNVGFLQNLRNLLQKRNPSAEGGPNTLSGSASSHDPRKRAKIGAEPERNTVNHSMFDNDTSTQAFQYPPLEDTATGNTRLMAIDLFKSRTVGNIHCTLISTQPWKKGLGYKCLSYVWGDSHITKKIFVKPSLSAEAKYSPFYITTNLEAVLRRLLDMSRSEWFWIDAICINQADLQERALQVSMMKEIYSHGTGVAIWLGESTAELSEAVSIIKAISAQFFVDTGRPPQSIVGPDGLRLCTEDIDRLKSYFSADDPHPEKSSADSYRFLSYFFSLPWFRRVWVLQEAFSHASISVHLGEHEISWGSIILAALWQACFTRDNIARSVNDFSVDESPRGFLPEMWLGLLHTKPLRGLPMVELVCRARDFEASDPRDKVFAMLGLANDLGDVKSNPAGLRPNYDRSKAEVYCNFAQDLISKTGTLDILSAVNTFHPRQTTSFPSWMPDLDAPITTIRGLGFPRKYNAAFSTRVKTSTSTQNASSNPTLPLSGFVIGTIHTMASDVVTFRRDLRVYMGATTLDAVQTLWTEYIKPLCKHSSEKIIIPSYVNLLAAAGFALPTEFPAHPLGKIVPSRDIPSLIADFAAYWSRIDPNFIDFEETKNLNLKKLAESGDAEQFGVIAGKGCHERKFFLAEDQTMGLCPWGAEIGDKLVILYGGSVPYVVRDVGDGGWRFVGEAYVDGWMFGEAGVRRGDLGLTEQVFCLR